MLSQANGAQKGYCNDRLRVSLALQRSTQLSERCDRQFCYGTMLGLAGFSQRLHQSLKHLDAPRHSILQLQVCQQSQSPHEQVVMTYRMQNEDRAGRKCDKVNRSDHDKVWRRSLAQVDICLYNLFRGVVACFVYLRAC